RSRDARRQPARDADVPVDRQRPARPVRRRAQRAGAMAIEGAVHRDNEAFEARLQSLAIPSYYDDYGAGTHSWSCWARDLRESMDPLMEDFAHPPPAPPAVTYTSADNAYGVYGWQVAMHRDAREFSTLQDASCGGFALAGSGSATVTTPACLSPGARYSVAL